MITYPINIRRNSYKGSDANKKKKASNENRIAAELEACVNKLLKEQKEPIRSYNYIEIVRASGHDLETVREFCFSIDCGSNGFTAYRHDLGYEEAFSEHAKLISKPH